MQVVIRSDADAVNVALRMARTCHAFITGEVRGVEEIRPGHRLACPLVNDPFWIVKLVLEKPPVSRNFSIHLTGVSEDLLLLVTKRGRVFHWPHYDEEFEQMCSESYVAESSLWELVPSRAKKVTREEWRQICIDSNREIEQIFEELARKTREEREKEFWSEVAEIENGSEDAFELPTMEDFLAQLGEDEKEQEQNGQEE